jgi:hypothetical protein
VKADGFQGQAEGAVIGLWFETQRVAKDVVDFGVF